MDFFSIVIGFLEMPKRKFVVERTFGTLKRTYGLARSRYIGLEKVASEVNLKAIAYNLTRAANVYIYKDLMTT